jgi:hypothetical protein
MLGLQRSHKEAMMITKRTFHAFYVDSLLRPGYEAPPRNPAPAARQWGMRGEKTVRGLLKFVYAFLVPMQQSIFYGDGSPAAGISAAWKGYGENRALSI